MPSMNAEDYFGKSFGKIIALIFPGFIFLVEIIVLLFPQTNLFNSWLNLSLSWDKQIILFLMFVFVGTMLGVIIDAIAQFIFEEVIDRIVYKLEGKNYKEEMEKEYPYNIDTLEKLEIYKYCIDDWIYYWYQAWSNMAVSLTLLPLIIWRSKIILKYLIFTMALLVILILFYMGYQAYKNWEKEDEQITKEFGKESRKSNK